MVFRDIKVNYINIGEGVLTEMKSIKNLIILTITISLIMICILGTNIVWDNTKRTYDKEEDVVLATSTVLIGDSIIIEKAEEEEEIKEEITEEVNNNDEENIQEEDTAINSEANDNNDKRIVVIDPGHGGNGNSEKELQSPDSNILKIKDPGGCIGVSTGIPEYKVAWQVSMKLKSILESKGITVVLTKEDINESPGNIERAEVGNNNNANLEIRIHCDSASTSNAYGATTLVPGYTGYGKSIADISRGYGEIIQKSLVDKCNMYNRGVVTRDDLTGFNWSKVPVVLVELGFLSNPNEEQLLISDEYQNKLAEGMSEGIIKCLGI